VKFEISVAILSAVLLVGCSESSGKPKTADDCLLSHIARIDAIRTFTSEENWQRQIDKAVKDSQVCGEMALQERMKK
jgi:hypothetical protein